MKSVVRTMAIRVFTLSALAAALSSTAVAAPVCDPNNQNEICIDFEQQGGDALTNKEPMQVQSVSNVYFGNAWAYEWNMLSGSDTSPADGNDGGFVMNRNRDATTYDIVMSLEDLTVAAAAKAGAAAGATAYPGQFFTKITFLMFTSADVPVLNYIDARTGMAKTKELTSGDGNLFWTTTPVTFTFDAQEQVRSVAFSALSKDGSLGLLGLDDLSITLTNGVPSVSVPEPASYALVGLALLAAGATSRRRR